MQQNTKKVQNVMNKLIKNITSYITYLQNECNLNVSIHFSKSAINSIPRNVFLKLLPYNSHNNSYCVMAKTINHSKCLEHQKNILEKSKNEDFLCEVCHANVLEYIYPIEINTDVLGYVAVSGYKPLDAIKKDIINHKLWSDALKTDVNIGLFDCVIPPLVVMLKLLLTKTLKETDNEYSLILQFLNEYHAGITLEHLAKHFGRSKSHISHLFKKECGVTIRAYCNNLKLLDAKNLLLNTDMSITRIAYETGFSNTSYFIDLFKEKFGETPLKFRQRN